MNLEELLTESLRTRGVSYQTFRQIVVKLLADGLICAGESRAETDLYQDACRAQSELESWLHVCGCRLHHDTHVRYMRVFPPNTSIPGVPDEESDLPNRMRRRLSAHETAAALVLRFLYEQGVQNGDIDEDGEVMIRLEDFNTAMATRLNREQPGPNERKQVFRTMRKLKILRFNGDEDLLDADTRLLIRPMITTLLHEPDLAEVVSAMEEEAQHAHS